MNIKILAQNIVNNPSNFTAEQIEKCFEDYAKLRLSDVSGRSELLFAYSKALTPNADDKLIREFIDNYLKANNSH